MILLVSQLVLTGWINGNRGYGLPDVHVGVSARPPSNVLVCPPPQPRATPRKRPPIRASSADEAIGKMLEQKKISSKINYDVLKDLDTKPAASPAPSPSPKEAPPPRVTPRQRRAAPPPLTLSTPLSTLGKRWVCPGHMTPAGLSLRIWER